MPKIRVTKEFQFEMAHALWDYDGACKNIHGHSYKLFVTIIGEPIDDNNNPKNGMVLDFGDLKKFVNSTIINKFDHAVVFSSHAPTKDLFFSKQMFEKYEILDFQPTCELLVADFAARIKPMLPPQIKLFSLKLYETSTSYAEWFASDNE
ncbi:MAG: 6-carboxytetrahydropterin synthase [Bacteroidota bacterium]